VSCLPFGVVEKPNGLYRGGEAYLSNAPSHPAGNASFIHSFHTMVYTMHLRMHPVSLLQCTSRIVYAMPACTQPTTERRLVCCKTMHQAQAQNVTAKLTIT